MKTLPRKKPWFECICFAAVMAGVPLVSDCQTKDTPAVQSFSEPVDPVVGSINNEEVSAEEYRMVMERQTALVYSYFRQKEGLEDHLGYWSESSGPQGPLAKLREMTQDELVRIKVTQSVAKEKGLIRETSFANFKMGFERENARRSAAKKAGEVIYGPVQYRLATYYYICLGDLVYKLKQALAKEVEAGIPESDIQKYYQENKTHLEEKPLDEELQKRIRAALAEQQVDKQLEALRASARVKMTDELLRAIVPRVDPVSIP